MNKFQQMIVSIVIIATTVIFSGIFYIVDETEQIVITQFGEPKGKPITEAGLHFKLPFFIQKINRFEKRLLEWDGKANQIPTLDKKYIWVDVTARWRIFDALQFMKTIRTEELAHQQLDSSINGATRDVISLNNLFEAVRNTNRLLESYSNAGLDETLDIDRLSIENIKQGRDVLSNSIQTKAKEALGRYGIELVDIRIKRINYIRDVRFKVYDRMVSERKRAAEQFRAEGQGKKAEIEGKVIKELKEIRSEAYKTSQGIKGEADAMAIKIYADAYNKDPQFYAFQKTLETYKKTIKKDTTLILSTDNEFFNQLEGLNLNNQE